MFANDPGKTLMSDNNNGGNKKKLWNMKVTIIPIVIGAFGTVSLLSELTSE